MDRHLNGSLTGEILVSSEWDRNMYLNKNAVEVESTLEIANGELINFEPLLGLSNFIALSELKDIKFSNLRNQVFIRNQQVILPNMDIKSSAFNISGSGIHNFDNHYTYRINVLLSEVLARKAKQNKKENDEFGIVEDDGLGKTKIPLMIVGFNGDYKITYDTRGVKEIVKESMKSQKRELRSIFKEEFGMYKNDTTAIKPKSNTRFKVEWEENQSTQQKKNRENLQKRKENF
ncbi:MAG: AsmA-like C-terminal region-containing protein [Bacteroidales bacterium]|nr:AsmA-like C-terminal region-containing protein [Bacteroidales bacterium]